MTYQMFCHPVEPALGGALAPVAAVTPRERIRGFRHRLSTAVQKPSAWAWQERNGDHVWERDTRSITFSVVIPARVMQP